MRFKSDLVLGDLIESSGILLVPLLRKIYILKGCIYVFFSVCILLEYQPLDRSST